MPGRHADSGQLKISIAAKSSAPPESAAPRKGRGRPREFNREEALDAALRLFWAKGYEPTSVAEICAAMDVNPPSLYATFGNKTALFLEAMRHYERLYWEKPAARFMREKNIYKAVDDYFQDAAKILLTPSAPCGCMTVLSAINISDDEKEIIAELKKLRSATREMFTERMRIAIDAGQIPADTNVPAIAGALTALLEGLSLQARHQVFLSELKAMAACAVRLLPPPPGK